MFITPLGIGLNTTDCDELPSIAFFINTYLGLFADVDDINFVVEGCDVSTSSMLKLIIIL
jgi:hypothetical protein